MRAQIFKKFLQDRGVLKWYEHNLPEKSFEKVIDRLVSGEDVCDWVKASFLFRTAVPNADFWRQLSAEWGRFFEDSEMLDKYINLLKARTDSLDMSIALDVRDEVLQRGDI